MTLYDEKNRKFNPDNRKFLAKLGNSLKKVVSDKETNSIYVLGYCSDLITIRYNFETSSYISPQRIDIKQSKIVNMIYSQKRRNLVTWGKSTLQITVLEKPKEVLIK